LGIARNWSKSGRFGLLGANIPEEYGGLALDQTTGVVVAKIWGALPVSATFGAQTSIGLLPILYFGSEELKEKYIPPIVSGEAITAYCLSEAGSGSDALGAKCNAKLSEDGTHYILNGEKMWITNGGFADMYIVFAKVDGEKKSFRRLSSNARKIVVRARKNTKWASNLLRPRR
jgi:alkylation response protein AidB-like acyl-CoA dehydrogenase